MQKAKEQSAAASLRVQQLEEERKSLVEHFGGWDIEFAINEATEQLERADEQEEETETAIEALSTKLQELEAQPAAEAAQKEIAKIRRSLTSQQNSAEKLAITRRRLSEILTELGQSLTHKFAEDPQELERTLASLLSPSWLPKVVFWENLDEYILKGETDFKDLRQAKSFADIPRPLANLFRIGLGVKTVDELKAKITEIRDESGERSRYDRKMNDAVQRYLKTVWLDYDQSIRVTLERERIRVEFFDPAYPDAAYYSMSERSQGCKTFLSFLLTVGAEAKHGVIRDTVLLLDEPENRLHPSGVRHMLEELIVAANNGNTVVFATHSVFMIDRKKFDRHVIVAKRVERTTLTPSTRGRVGLFMQEEVLYGALEANMNADFETMKSVNFVFEGEGDTTLFERLHLLSVATPAKGKAPGFYQGGKCSDIQRFMIYKPIQLLSKWFFVLDNDAPANELKTFLEKRYREHIDRSVFIFQYQREGIESPEFEDLLPRDFVRDAMVEAAGEQGEAVGAILDAVDADIAFTEYFKQAERACGETFKERFKAELNARVASTAAAAKTINEFATAFPEYAEWAQNVLTKVRAALDPKTDGSKADPHAKPSLSSTGSQSAS